MIGDRVYFFNTFSGNAASPPAGGTDSLIPDSDKIGPNEKWAVDGVTFGVHGNAAIATGSSVTASLVDSDGFVYAKTIFHIPAAPAGEPGARFSPWFTMPPGGIFGGRGGSALYLRLLSGTGANLTSGYITCSVAARKIAV